MESNTANHQSRRDEKILAHGVSRGTRCKVTPSPGGATLLFPQVLRIVLNPVPVQKCHELFLKCLFLMVFFLISDIPFDRVSVGLADGEGPVPGLPPERV